MKKVKQFIKVEIIHDENTMSKMPPNRRNRMPGF